MIAIVVAYVLFAAVGVVTMHLALAEPKSDHGAFLWLVCVAVLVATAAVLLCKGGYAA